MKTLQRNEDLTPYIGTRLRISKTGSDGKKYTYEGVFQGRSPIAVVALGVAQAATMWTLEDDANAQLHFTHPNDGWSIIDLSDTLP